MRLGALIFDRETGFAALRFEAYFFSASILRVSSWKYTFQG